MPYTAVKRGGSVVLVHRGTKRRGKRTGKHSSKAAAYRQAAAIAHSERRRGKA